MAEQRYQAVLAVIADGETVKDVAARFLEVRTRLDADESTGSGDGAAPRTSAQVGDEA